MQSGIKSLRYRLDMKTAKMKLKRMVFGRSGERGLTLIEALVAVALLAALGVGFLSALTTSTNATTLVEKKVDVDQLARTQLEYIKGLDYIAEADYTPGAYDINGKPLFYEDIETAGLIELPADYTIVVSDPMTVDGDEDIQKITVTIQKDGADLLTLDGYKVHR